MFFLCIYGLLFLKIAVMIWFRFRFRYRFSFDYLMQQFGLYYNLYRHAEADLAVWDAMTHMSWK
jgi:hypothetical protein